MANTHDGGMKRAAAIIGIGLEEYFSHILVGENWCGKGKHWLPSVEFGLDRSRWNGLARVCRFHRYIRKTEGPTKRERFLQKASGLAWCRQCNKWLPVTDVHRGMCRRHISEEDRLRYKTNFRYRAERRQHSKARQRNVAPIPVTGQETILEEFKGLCAYCDNLATTWDHIVPVSQGGTTQPWNIVPACVSCNSSKNNRDLDEWLQTTKRSVKVEVYERQILQHLPLA